MTTPLPPVPPIPPAPRRRPSPIERFLGHAAAASGPFALLGLNPDGCTDEQIVAALERQTQRIESHPEGDTPEADEVRLALHAAAAQLLDAAVRQQLIYRWREGRPSGPPAADAGSPADRAGLEHDALITLAQYGGWNKESLRRLALLASARGLPSSAVADTLFQLSKRGPASAAAAPPAQPPPPTPRAQSPLRPASPAPPLAAPPPTPVRPTAPAEDESPKNKEMLVIAAALAVGAVALVTLLSIIIVVTSKQVAPQQTAAVTPAPAPPAPAPATPTTPQPPAQQTPSPSAPPAFVSRYSDVHEAIRALRGAADTAREHPDQAAPIFADAAGWIAGWWCRLEIGQLRAANDAAVEYIYAIARWPDDAAGAVDILAAAAAPLRPDSPSIDATEVWPAAWSAGMLVRLTRERDLPAELAARIENALAATLGVDRPRYDAAFSTGAAAALVRMPLRFVAAAPASASPALPGPALGRAADPASAEPALRRWAEAIAATHPDPLAQERLLIDGLEQILVSAPEPDASRRVFEAIGFLATEIRWRRSGPARARLVDWFRDPRISSGDLNVLTNAMATGSAAENVGPTMVLQWSAPQHDREKLRAQYADAWGIAEAAGRDESAQAWAQAAAASLQSTLIPGQTTTPTTAIAAAAELALLNGAARHLWRGETGYADNLTQQSRRAADLAQTSLGSADRAGSVLRPGNANDGQWALAFISAGQNRQLRLERITELDSAGTLGGPADAETLVEAACFASPSEVRAAAQRVVTRFAADPLVVNAMLELLPKAPKIDSISLMIEGIAGVPLPSPSDPDWMLLARRALVERLAEVLAAGSQGFGAFDRLAALLRSAYFPPDASESSLARADAPAAELADLWRTWRAEAESFTPNPHAPIPLEKIVSRRAGRAALALGPVQTWAAEQAGLAELLAYIVSGEAPSRAPAVRDIMTEHAAARRDATHIFEQVLATERAMLRLWLLRFEKEAAWSGN